MYCICVKFCELTGWEQKRCWARHKKAMPEGRQKPLDHVAAFLISLHHNFLKCDSMVLIDLIQFNLI